MSQPEPKFKGGERVWSPVFETWGTVKDADILDLLTGPYIQYHVDLDTERGDYHTTEDYLQSEAEHNAARDGGVA